MHMNGKTSTYNVIELFRPDTNYSNLLLQILGHLRYSKFYFILHKIAKISWIKFIQSFWDYFHSLNYYVRSNIQKSSLVHF
jgi:hypothetical protein